MYRHYIATIYKHEKNATTVDKQSLVHANNMMN